MNLDEWLSYIAASHPSEIELGLDRIKRVWHNLSKTGRVARQQVLVAGTNGKGSTVAMIEQALVSMGCSVGSYTSPHITHYNERVKVQGEPLCDEDICSGFAAVEAARGDVPLTYFEFGTLAALWNLSAANLDVVVLEIGLGGRLDAVNIVDADIAAITSIALDHADWLGTDLEQIGREKAGIIRPNSPVVIGAQVTKSVYETASNLGAPVRAYGRDFYLDDEQAVFDISGELIRLEWPGSVLPSSNVLVAVQTLVLLQKALSQKVAVSEQDSLAQKIVGPIWPGSNELQVLVEQAAATCIPGRLEAVTGHDSVFLDVGHNPQAAEHLRAFLARQGKTVYAVYSALSDKDVEGVVTILSECVDKWFVAPLKADRAMPLNTLEKKVGPVAKDMVSFARFEEAISAATESSSEEVVVLIFGSFFVVEAAKAYFSNNE